ncbi:putative von Willebrand factor A domain-containing protein 9 [Apostichopus japonicus]|uniref:Integrator complex subunit 14 n=2 Tax=Stichopus japonicus TaxID=307972 RepID=A0A2G8LMF6_STIJA|nr:putative von Willebrand factor A domain-containing protein 9 [Apostichopus japonicus]
MSRPLSSTSTCDAPSESRLSLAKTGLQTFFDYTATNNRLEFSSLVIFSSLWEVKKTFTRDYGQLKQALAPIDVFDKTNLEIGLFGLSTVILEEWGSGMPCQVIIVTDGSPGSGPGSLTYLMQSESTALLPLPFEHSLHVVLMASASEIQDSIHLYQELVKLNGRGTIHTVEGQPSVKNVQNLFLKIAEKCHEPFKVTLSCGNLNSVVQMFPPPNFDTFALQSQTFWDDFKICGFLNTVDVSSPPTLSRHLVLPVSVSDKKKGADDSGEGVNETDSNNEDGRAPSFCVLLHGSIRVENMVAVVQVGPIWYGIMYSWADTKKKANLILALFEPGLDSIPWLGKFDLLGPCSAFEFNPYGENEAQLSPFPVRPTDKRSYSSNPVVWIKSGSLQSDIQKVLRYARKLPDKMGLFYKELNRIRRAAMTLSMMDLLQGLSEMLERECTLLPGTAHPDAALQLTHAARMITLSFSEGYNYSISALTTNFTSGT